MMHRYKVTGPFARFGEGERLALSPEQIKARSFALTVVDEKAGVVTVTGKSVEFKRGEMVGLTAAAKELPKFLAEALTPEARSK